MISCFFYIYLLDYFLEETFNEMDTIYNIDDLEHGIIETL